MLRRIDHTRRILKSEEANRNPSSGVWADLRRGTLPRGSVAYDVVTFAAIGSFVVAPWVFPFFYGRSDPLRTMLTPLMYG
jgi:hypothetical protein